MTEHEFFELNLGQMATGQSRKAQTTRDIIMKSFPDRELFTIHHPTSPENPDGATIFGDLREANLCDEYVGDVDILREKLFTETPIKQIWSRTITGSLLSKLLVEYV